MCNSLSVSIGSRTIWIPFLSILPMHSNRRDRVMVCDDV